MRKNIIFVCSALIFFAFLLYKENQSLVVTFCDVGQGDATLLTLGWVQILIDAGPNAKVLECLENHLPFWDKKIEFFILTHMDRDHIGGATQVLDYFDVDFIFMNPSNKKTSDFDLLEAAVSRKKSSGTVVVHTFVGQQVMVANQLTLTVASPQVDFPQVEAQKTSSTETILSDKNSDFLLEKISKISENNLSIALFVTFKNITLVLPGDLESEGELALVRSGLPNQLSILKAGHHGSKTSSSPQFIEVLKPEVTVISSGKNNSYNHPNPQVVATFLAFGVTIYQTSTSGTVSFMTDGATFWEM